MTTRAKRLASKYALFVSVGLLFWLLVAAAVGR